MSLCYLLCAGEGTRLRPHTLKCPKPCIPFLNLPLAYYGFYLARKGGVTHFLMNKHHLPNQIDALASSLRPFADKVETIDETEKLLGSGGALWNARDILRKHDYFLVANSDEVMIPSNDGVIKQLFEKAKNENSLCALLTCDHPELLKTLKAVWTDDKGFAQGFGMDAPAPSLNPVHYTGYKVFSKKIFDWLPEGESNIFYEVLVKAIEAGEKVGSLHMGPTPWYETGNFDSLLNASRSVAKENWEVLNQRRTFFGLNPLFKKEKGSQLLVCEQESQLQLINQTKGTVVLGKNTSVAANAVLENIVATTEVGQEPNTMYLGEF